MRSDLHSQAVTRRGGVSSALADTEWGQKDGDAGEEGSQLGTPKLSLADTEWGQKDGDAGEEGGSARHPQAVTS